MLKGGNALSVVLEKFSDIFAYLTLDKDKILEFRAKDARGTSFYS
jgi:hypothetical protein